MSSLLFVENSFSNNDNWPLGRADKTSSKMDGNFVQLRLRKCGDLDRKGRYERVWRLGIRSQGDSSDSFSSVTGKLATLMRVGLDSQLNGHETSFAPSINALNGRIYEVRSNWCLPFRFLATLLNATPEPINGTFESYEGKDSSRCRKENVSYIHAAYDRHNQLMQEASKEASQSKKLYSQLPFVAFLIDTRTLGQVYFPFGYHHFLSLKGRANLAFKALVYVVQSVAMPIMQIVWIVQNSRLWPQHHNSFLSTLDALLGVTLSPIVPLANAVKCAVAAIIHPGIVYAELPQNPV